MKAREIKSWEDVDQALKELGQLDFEIEQKEGRMTQIIQKIQERYKPGIEEKTGASEAIIQEIKSFCGKHKSEFGGKQTKDLNFGQVKFKLGKPSYVFLKEEEEIADTLLRMGKNECVKIEKKVIKNALKGLAENILQKISVKFVPGALNWFISAYREKIVPTKEK